MAASLPWTNDCFCQLVEAHSTTVFPPKIGSIFQFVRKSSWSIPKASNELRIFLLTHGIDCSPKSLEASMRRHTATVKGLVKNVKRDRNALQEFLNTEFVFPKIAPQKPPKQPPPLKVVSPRKLKADCEKCPGMRQKAKSLKDRFLTIKKENAAVKQRFRVKLVNQDRKRKEDSIHALKIKLKTMKNKNHLLEKELKFFRQNRSIDTLTEKLKMEKRKTDSARIQLKKLEQKIKELRQTVNDKEVEIQALEVQLSELEDEAKETMTVKKVEVNRENTRLEYNLTLRKCFYKCLLSEVPVEKAASLVNFIWVEACGDNQKMPGPTTIAQMAYELGTLSDIQIGEAWNRTSSCTLSWDATTKAGVHVNEVHVCVDDGIYTLQIGDLPGGRTEDYMEHISQSVAQIARSYASYSGDSYADMLQRFYDTTTSTLTDRAPVNNCVSAELSVLMNKQLIILNCNIHPLDGLASAARSTLKQTDRDLGVKSAVFGNEGCAANFLYAISKLRYKDGPGDPAGFRTFLDNHKIKPGVIVRYRGNRLHVLFHLAGTVLLLKDSLILYLKKYCTAAKLRLALLADLANENILLQLQILGLLGKTLTGPWMTLFYGNKDQHHHLEMVPYLKRCLEALSAMESDPSLLLTTDSDVFGNPFTDDGDVLKLRLSITSEHFNSVATQVITAMKVLLQRQLKSYLEGVLSQPSQELLTTTKNAPVTNMHSERVLGVFDGQIRRAPNATIGFVDGKIKSKINRTFEWLCKKGTAIQEHLIQFSVSYAAIQRQALSKRSATIRATKVERQIQTGQKRDLSERRKLEKEIQSFLDSSNLAGLHALLDSNIHELVNAVVARDTSIFNVQINHLWNVDGVDRIFSGKIVGFRAHKKGQSLDIDYGGGSLTAIPVKEFIADIAMGDLSLP